MTNELREPAVDDQPMAKRLILGDPLASTDSEEHLLPKKRALPIFASDALSSVAYAPQELLLILLTGGLAFLAFCPAREIDAALQKPLEKFTDHTVVDPELIRALLEETAARGFSISHQGLEAGVISAAAPVRAPDGRPVGCVAVAAPLSRTTTTAIHEFGAQAAATANGISEKYYGSERLMGTSPNIRRRD